MKVKYYLFILSNVIFSILICSMLSACDMIQQFTKRSGVVGTTVGDNSNDTSTDNQTHTHSFGEWVVVTPSTCTQKGTEQRTCACGVKETRDIALIMHVNQNGYCAHCGSPIPVAEGLVYTLQGDDTYSISGYNGADSIIYIPTKHQGKSVTSIESRCFNNCYNLTSIAIPDSVTSIGEFAFDCTGLTTIIIPKSVTSISAYAFSNCPLTNIYYNGSIAQWCESSGLDGLRNKVYYSLYIDGALVAGELVIPDGVTKIESNAFHGVRRLTSVFIPDSVTSIGVGAFESCSGLTSVTIGNGVTTIGSHAFAYSNLTSVTFGNSVTTIEGWAFSYCKGLTAVTIPDGVTSIGGGTFLGCYGLISISLPSSVSEIDTSRYGMFENCINLTSITVAEGNSKYHSVGNCIIETHTKTLVAGCKASVIPDDGSVTTIGSNAFCGCIGMNSISIPGNVTSIEECAFLGCNTLIEINNHSNLDIRVGDIDNGYVGYYAKNVYSAANGSKLSTDKQGFIRYTDGAEIILVGYCGNSQEITIPDDITEINQEAFYLNEQVTSLKCSTDSQLSIIGYKAFFKSGLMSVVIPNSVTIIEDLAFGCQNLVSASVPDNGAIPSALYQMGSLTEINYRGTMSQWNALSDKGWLIFCDINCVDGKIEGAPDLLFAKAVRDSWGVLCAGEEISVFSPDERVVVELQYKLNRYDAADIVVGTDAPMPDADKYVQVVGIGNKQVIIIYSSKHKIECSVNYNDNAFTYGEIVYR